MENKNNIHKLIFFRRQGGSIQNRSTWFKQTNHFIDVSLFNNSNTNVNGMSNSVLLGHRKRSTKSLYCVPLLHIKLQAKSSTNIDLGAE